MLAQMTAHLADGGELAVCQSHDCGEPLNWPINEGVLPAEVMGPNPDDLAPPWWCLAVPGSCLACRLHGGCQLPRAACGWPLRAPAWLIRQAAASVQGAESLHREATCVHTMHWQCAVLQRPIWVLPWRTQILRVTDAYFGRWELQGGIPLHDGAAQEKITCSNVRDTPLALDPCSTYAQETQTTLGVPRILLSRQDRLRDSQLCTHPKL